MICLPFSDPAKERAVIGFIVGAGFTGVSHPHRIRPDAFSCQINSVIYEAAVWLHLNGKIPTAHNLIHAIEADKTLSHLANESLKSDGFPDLLSYTSSLDASLVGNACGGEIVSQYLAEIAEAAGRRKAREICKQGEEGVTSIPEIIESLQAIESYGRVYLLPPSTPMLSLEGRTPDPENTFFQGRFLCRKGAMLFVGPSGIGKSSASVQQDICWSIGREAFGIRPTRPLRILHIQAENDEDDMTEMVRGVAAEIQMSDAERNTCLRNLLTRQHSITSGKRFLSDFLNPALEADRPDIVRIDPLHAYAGCDITNAQEIGMFCREGIQPLMDKYGCGSILNHHTPKTTNRDTSNWRASDWMYSGAGSADLTNWVRAIMVIEPTANPGAFRFIAPKRGRRLGWITQGGESTIEKLFCHSEGKISWREATEDEVASIKSKGKGQPPTDECLMSYVPMDNIIAKDSLLHKWNSPPLKLGEKKCRRAIQSLIEEGKLFEIEKKRPGTRAKIFITRHEPTLL